MTELEEQPLQADLGPDPKSFEQVRDDFNIWLESGIVEFPLASHVHARMGEKAKRMEGRGRRCLEITPHKIHMFESQFSTQCEHNCAVNSFIP